MATVQQLEKLYHIRRLFHAEDSLEAAVAGERVKNMIERTEQLIRLRSLLREERRYLRTSAEALEEYKVGLAALKKENWIPEQLMSLPKRCIQLNIGGLMFEVDEAIMRRDAASLLSQLCDEDPPVMKDPNGIFYFDRDWWLFRYILVFLRDGSLPQDRVLLAQLYREAAYWQLVELQKAIEEDKLHLRTKPSETDEEELNKWWRKALDVKGGGYSGSSGGGSDNKDKEKTDWWTGSKYQGKSFLPISTDPAKVVAGKGDPDAIKSPEATWYNYSGGDQMFGGGGMGIGIGGAPYPAMKFGGPLMNSTAFQ